MYKFASSLLSPLSRSRQIVLVVWEQVSVLDVLLRVRRIEQSKSPYLAGVWRIFSRRVRFALSVSGLQSSDFGFLESQLSLMPFSCPF